MAIIQPVAGNYFIWSVFHHETSDVRLLGVGWLHEYIFGL